MSLISLRNGHQVDGLQHTLDNVECGKGNVGGPEEVDTSHSLSRQEAEQWELSVEHARHHFSVQGH